MKKNIIAFFAVAMFASNLYAVEIKVGAGAAPTENVLKPNEVEFEKTTKHNLTIIASGPKLAFIDLDRGAVDAAAAGLSFDDWMQLLKKEGVAVADKSIYKQYNIGKDKIIVITHKNNKITKLDKAQLAGIFTGKITNWKDVGGADSPILVVWGGLIQGTNSMFIKHILDGAKPATEVINATTAEDVRQNVAANPEAIGIGPQSILNSSIYSPETPEIARPITLITKGEPKPAVKELLDFIAAHK